MNQELLKPNDMKLVNQKNNKLSLGLEYWEDTIQCVQGHGS